MTLKIPITCCIKIGPLSHIQYQLAHPYMTTPPTLVKGPSRLSLMLIQAQISFLSRNNSTTVTVPNIKSCHQRIPTIFLTLSQVPILFSNQRKGLTWEMSTILITIIHCIILCIIPPHIFRILQDHQELI